MKLLLLVLLTLVSCQDYNSNSADRERYGTIELDETDPNFAQAYSIIQKRCASCHEHARWAGFITNDDWIAEKYAIPGSSVTSSVITSTINAGGSMPLGGSPLPNEEFDHLKKWIDEMQ